MALVRDGFTLEASFSSNTGVTALFGRSGSGKTTLVELLAGLLRPTRGRIVIDGRVLVDTERGVFVPAHKRRLGYVFQEGRLFPHLTVRQNLLYGRWLTPRAERRGDLAEVVELLGIAHLLERRPRSLSGGEKQRVAIGRALLASPRLLLMDEPLASLDAARKAEILPYVERLKEALCLPIVYVSHALDEVVRIADTLVLLSGGQVMATGPTAELLTRLDLRPFTGRFEAGSLLTARIEEHLPAFGLTVLAHPAGRLRLPRLELPAGATVRLRVRARDVALATGALPAGLSIRNRLAATVVEVATDASPIADIRLSVGGEPLVARITREALDELDIAPGRAVTALIKTIAFERRTVIAAGRSDDGTARSPAS